LKFLGFKKKVEKFLLDESGGMSKKAVLTLGLISSIAAASHISLAENTACDAEGGYHCYKADDGNLKFLIHTHSTTDHNGNRAFDICFDTKRLFDVHLLDRPPAEESTPINSVMSGKVQVTACDHLSSVADCHLDAHFNSSNCDTDCKIEVPQSFFHHNNLDITNSGDTLTGSHTHDITDIGEQVIDCHISDHWDADYWDCGGHYSQNEELGAGSQESFDGTCPDELSISEQGRVEMD